MATSEAPLLFEAHLAQGRTTFSMDGEGQCTLVLQVPSAAAAPLSLAMSRGLLQDRTFVVEIKL